VSSAEAGRFSVAQRLLTGLISGLVGAVAAALILWGAWMLPVLGLLLARVSLVRGVAVTALIGAAGGLLYGAAFRRPPSLRWSIVAGLVYGVSL
jgi:hypothetical protein